MSTNENNLGMGRAEKLWITIDPEATSPEVYQMLCDIPGDRIAHIIEACDEFKDDFSREILLKAANDEAFTREGRNHGEIGAFLHLVAVVAPVIAAFHLEPSLRNPDGSVASLVVTNIYRYKSAFEAYWGETLQSFHLHEKNRKYFARGWAFLTFMNVGEFVLDAELDRHLMWIGSKFDDLRGYAHEIADSGKYDKGSLDEFADKSLNEADTKLSDGSPNQQWYADNRERLMGYSKDGYYSLFPESVTNDLIERHGKTCVMISGVPVRIEEFIYLERRHEGSLEDAPFMKVLGLLSDGIEMESPFAGQAALLFSTFSDYSIHAFGHMIEGYAPEVRATILKIVLDHAALRKPLNAPLEDERFIGTVIAVAPVFHYFFEASYSPDDTEKPDGWTDSEWKAELLERHDDAMWRAVHDCYDHLINAELDEAALKDFGLMVMFMRAMTLTHFVPVESSEPEERTIIDIGLINDNLDAICQNAKLIIKGRSLSFETIASLPKN